MADSAAPGTKGDRASKDGEQSLQQPLDAVKMTTLPLDPALPNAGGAREPPVPAKDQTSVAVPEKGKERAATSPTQVAGDDSVDAPESPSKGKTRAAALAPLEARSGEDSHADEDDAAENPPTSPTSQDAIVCRLTLIIVSTGGKWNFRVDTKYLEKRDVEIPEGRLDGRPDPFSISIKTLKQLLMRDWKPEWGPKPPDSQYMKLISYGKVLEDGWRLTDAKFSEQSENPVHVSVTPIDMIHEDEGDSKNLRDKAAGGSRGRERGESSGCCIIL